MSSRATSGSLIEGKYRLERELGAGGMGAVWLATQLMVDRPVAIKLLHPSFLDQEDLQARFEVEAKAIGRLNHPNVITLYDFGFSDELGAFYTAIEYIDGVSLDKKLDRRLPLPEIVDIIKQIALALDHAHHHGILHRDLKPENVMLARMTDGTEMVKVLDFGIARIVSGTGEEEPSKAQRITKAGEVFGTPAYMSPEQARSVRSLTPAADLYSLGVIFYELVAGSLPFFAQSAFDLLMMHVTKPVPPIRRSDVTPELMEMINRLLEKEPEKRFQSGRDLAKALDALELANVARDNDDLDAGPTIVKLVPRATPEPRGSTAPMFDEETKPLPPGASFSEDGPRQATMMLGAGDSFETGGFQMPDRRKRLALLTSAALFAIVLFAGVLYLLSAESSTPDAAASEEPRIAQPSDLPTEELPRSGTNAGEGDIATAAEIDPSRKAHTIPEGDPEPTESEVAAKKAEAAKKEAARAEKERLEAEAARAEEKRAAKERAKRRAKQRRAKHANRKKEEKKPLFQQLTTEDGSESKSPSFNQIGLD